MVLCMLNANSGDANAWCTHHVTLATRRQRHGGCLLFAGSACLLRQTAACLQHIRCLPASSHAWLRVLCTISALLHAAILPAGKIYTAWRTPCAGETPATNKRCVWFFTTFSFLYRVELAATGAFTDCGIAVPYLRAGDGDVHWRIYALVCRSLSRILALPCCCLLFSLTDHHAWPFFSDYAGAAVFLHTFPTGRFFYCAGIRAWFFIVLYAHCENVTNGYRLFLFLQFRVSAAFLTLYAGSGFSLSLLPFMKHAIPALSVPVLLHRFDAVSRAFARQRLRRHKPHALPFAGVRLAHAHAWNGAGARGCTCFVTPAA